MTESTAPLTMFEWANVHNIASNNFAGSNLKHLHAALSQTAALPKATEPSAQKKLAERFPSYQKLFSQVKALGPVDHDRSMLSPAAYFVDLMRLIESKVRNAPSGMDLHSRRSGLWDIPLDAKNTVDEQPYLEIVNQVILDRLKSDLGADPHLVLATARHPFDLPANIPFELIRAYLNHFKIDLQTIYETFHLPENHPALVAESLSVSRIGLGYLTAEHDSGILSQAVGAGTPPSDITVLAEAYGLPQMTTEEQLLSVLSDVGTFMKQTDLTPEEFAELIPFGTPQFQPLSISLKKVSGDANAPERQHIDNLDQDTLRNLNRFIRWQNCLGWSYGELDRIFTAVKRDEDANPSKAEKNGLPGVFLRLSLFRKLGKKYAMSGEEFCNFLAPIDTRVLEAASEDVQEKSQFDRIFNTPPFYQPDADPIAPDYHPKGIGFPDSTTPPLIWNASTDLASNTALTPDLLDGLMQLESVSDGHFDSEPIIQSAEQGDLETARARRKDALSKFLHQPSHPLPKPPSQQNIRASLIAALGVSNDDLQAMVEHLSTYGQPKLKMNAVPLDVPTLTRLYRLSKMALALQLSVSEYLSLLNCITGTGKNKLNTAEVDRLDDLKTIDYWASWLRQTGLHPYQFQYLTTRKLPDHATHLLGTTFSKSGLDHLRKTILDELQPLFIKPQSFQTAYIKQQASIDIYSSLVSAEIIKPVQANVQSAEDPSQPPNVPQAALCRHTVTSKQVVNALKQAPSEALSMFTLNVDMLTVELKNLRLDTDINIEEVADYVCHILHDKQLINDSMMLALDGDDDFQVGHETDFNNLLEDVSKSPDLESVVTFVRDKLLQNASAIRSIRDTLNVHLTQQNKTTVTDMASYFHQDSKSVENAMNFLNTHMQDAARFTDEAVLLNTASLLFLSKSLNLKPEMFEALLIPESGSIFGLAPPDGAASDEAMEIGAETLQLVSEFSGLVELFETNGSAGKKTTSELVEFLSDWSLDGNDKDLIAKLGHLSGWREDQVKLVQKYLAGKVPANNNTISNLVCIKRCFELKSKLGVDMQFLTQLAYLQNSDEKPTSLDEYTNAAKGLLSAMKAQYDASQWPNIYDPLNAHLNEVERDVLTRFTIWHLNQPDSTKVLEAFGPIENLKDLSDYLLVDVEMSGVAKISKIKLGLNTLQRYVQRCHMGLEGDVTVGIGDKEWTWRSHYRLWEANRKVFLHPENYLEPGLRKIKTPIFKELEDALLQGEITNDSVTKAYLRYFDKLDVLTQLTVVDACSGIVTDPGNPDGVFTIFVVGRTNATTPEFYHRSAVLAANNNITGWSPWQKIDLHIPVNTVRCVYAEHRLNLFWSETTEKTHRAEKTGAKTTWTFATVKFTHQNVSGDWFAPLSVPGLEELLIATTAADPKTHKPKQTLKVLYPKPHSVLGAEAALILAAAFNGTKPVLLMNFDWNYPRPDQAKKDIQALFPEQAIDGGFLRYSFSRYPKSVDSWVPSGSGLPTDCHFDRFARGSGGKTIYLTGHGPGAGLYSSDDDGTTWTLLKKSDATNVADRLFILVSGKDLILGISVAEKPSSTMSFAEGGKSWTPGQPMAGVMFSLALGADGKTIFAGTDKGVFTSGNQGASWVPKSKGIAAEDLQIQAFLASPDKKTMFAGAIEAVYSSVDNGLNWTKMAAPTKFVTVSFEVGPDGKTLFAGATEGVFRSTNNGKNWIKASHGLPTSSAPLDGVPAGRCMVSGLGVGPYGGILFAACSIDNTAFDVYYTFDNGDSWLPINKGAVPGYELQSLLITEHRILAAFYSKTTVNAFELSRFVVFDQKDGGRHSVLGMPGDKGAYSQYELNSKAAGELRNILIQRGLDALLSLPSQSVPEFPIGASKKLSFDLSSAYAIYYREIFLHIPFLIADTLNRNQKFEDAQKWYHHVFNPTPMLDAHGAVDKKDTSAYWRYLPFKGHQLEKLTDIEKRHPQEFKVYSEDPFDPHAIAGMRMGAYEKAIVMKYIDNLLEWGDQLFAQDNWESIVQAMTLYVLAQELLGKKPRSNSLPYRPAPSETYASFKIKYPSESKDSPDTFHVSDTAYFPVPPNTNFAGYWDFADDRLFKIRHSMNIKGLVRQLALFQPPIDPMQIIRALAGGGDLANAANQLSEPVPHYRFSVVLRQAKSVAGTLAQLGSSLLAALEKKDVEQLSLLRSTNERAILNLTTKLKRNQIEDAGKTVESLNANLTSATKRHDYYAGAIGRGLLPPEQANLSLTSNSLTARNVARDMRGAAVAAHLIPTVFGFADGCFQPGSSVGEAASLSDAFGEIYSQQAGLAATQGQNARRLENWTLQKTVAEQEMSQIQAQIAGATIKQDVAQRELEIHQNSIQQADEKEQFLKGKFTNEDLYQWMIGRISTVYFQTYKLAVDLARAAEKAYQFERNTNDTFIIAEYWDSLKKGLLSGEGLLLTLDHLEKAHFDAGKRPMEIEKTISLRQIAPHAWLDLRAGGKCAFHLTEKLFDYDFPGHYCRKIVSIAITIPAIVGPYQNVQATLRQTANRVLLTPDPKGVDFLLSAKKSGAAAGDQTNVRTDWRRQQQVALSKGVQDDGLFELNFHDERYLPFEGTGAVSDWELVLPKATNNVNFESISDVIIHLRYTAHEDGTLRQHLEKPLSKFNGIQLVSVRQQFPSVWQAGQNGDTEIELVEKLFPMNLKPGTLALQKITMMLYAKPIAGDGSQAEPTKITAEATPDGKSGAKIWKLKLTHKQVKSSEDIIMLIPFEGTRYPFD